jgi:hypothetical protein
VPQVWRDLLQPTCHSAKVLWGLRPFGSSYTALGARQGYEEETRWSQQVLAKHRARSVCRETNNNMILFELPILHVLCAALGGSLRLRLACCGSQYEYHNIHTK